MTESTLCGYCVELPENRRGAATQLSRCPLCKAELGVNAAGRHFRIGADVPKRRRGAVIAVLAGGTAFLAVAAWLLRPAPVEEIPFTLPPPPAPIAAPAPIVEAPVAPIAPADIAQAKRFAEGALAPAARVKPQVGPLVSIPSRAEVVVEPNAAKVSPELPTAATKRIGQVHAAFLRQLPESDAFDVTGLKIVWDLVTAPEVTLDEPPNYMNEQHPRERAQTARQWLLDLAKKIDAKNEKEPDGFIRSLAQERADMAGMPFVLGKNCQLSATKARELGCASSTIRDALDVRERQRKRAANTQSGAARYADSAYEHPDSLWDEVGLGSSPQFSSGSRRRLTEQAAISVLPALMQILAAEPAETRVELVARYRKIESPQVTAALARLALYDPDAQVRANAREALCERRPEETAGLLVEALQYPWAPVALRAADTIVRLERKDLLPQLVALLDRADPATPFEQEIQGKKTIVVRELVKINHNRNCLLCHAPAPAPQSKGRDLLPLGAVPSPAEKIPPSRGAVYADRKGNVVVRVDVTYLRQDFSLMLPVEKAEPWPEMQRFDFLVRTRALSADEAQAWQDRLAAGPPAFSPQRRALLSALRRLTGVDAGASAAAWRQALAESASRQLPSGQLDGGK
jgi:hypothetical protein